MIFSENTKSLIIYGYDCRSISSKMVNHYLGLVTPLSGGGTTDGRLLKPG